MDKKTLEQIKIPMSTFFEQYKGWHPTPQGRVEEHPSLAFDLPKYKHKGWFWHSKGIGGQNAIDFLMEMENMNFKQACETLLKLDPNLKSYIVQEPQAEPIKEPIVKNLILPNKSKSYDAVVRYLVETRKLDNELVRELIGTGQIYQNTYGACVFVSHNNNYQPKAATWRNTSNNLRGFVKGSSRNYAFTFYTDVESHITTKIPATAYKNLFLFESVIDAIALASFLKKQNQSTPAIYSSLNGIPEIRTNTKLPNVINKLLSQAKNINTIHLCFDNDKAGSDASKNMIKALNGAFPHIITTDARGLWSRYKDVNEMLVSIETSKKQAR